GAAGRALGSSKKGMSSEKPDISPECSDSAAKGQNCLRFVPVKCSIRPLRSGGGQPFEQPQA
ncbi:MAG: hypothetical protein J0I79_23025, partial [Mesorhizobium sp.]|uniref:hypothetical protein n=1 Tax=Mesorhizobium sp. TaxID=1871066 RepID=UPI001AC478D2